MIEVSVWMLITIFALWTLVVSVAAFFLGMFFFAFLAARNKFVEELKDLEVPETK